MMLQIGTMKVLSQDPEAVNLHDYPFEPLLNWGEQGREA